jgi:hypothetical protein
MADRRRLAFGAAALVITVYGGLLRLEGMIAHYGWTGQPGWSEALARYATPMARELRPASVHWTPVTDPYAGSDPVNYLRHAREMTGFYQAHVREPLFLAITRGYLWLSDNRDIALSFASVTGGTLAILATCLLGAGAFSRGVGLAAGLALAIEFTAIARCLGGWRDDTFMCLAALTAWSFVRLRRAPTTPAGVIAGLAAAGACLTRITALSFVVPGLLWIVLESPVERRLRKGVLTAVLVTAALVAPYLISCAVVVGDPFFAVNDHTKYYRTAEGLPGTAPMSALSYLSMKIQSRPIGSLDTAAQGLLTVPLLNKWDGFAPWNSALGPALLGMAVAGMVLAAWSATGRFLLMLLFTSLLPYALTWRVGTGGDWRFTQHAYPFYLVLSISTIPVTYRWVKTLASDVAARRRLLGSLAVRMAIVAAVAGLAWTASRASPFLIYGEALRAGEAVSVETTDRNAWMFAGAWSERVGTGNVKVRIAAGQMVGMRLVMPARTDYWLTLRLDPAETADPGYQPDVRVFLNRQHLAHLRLTREPGRVGSYRIRVERDLTRMINRLDLVASHLVRAGESGIHYSALPAETPVAFRLWYVRLEPAGEVLTSVR